jgi:hypothetical protein
LPSDRVIRSPHLAVRSRLLTEQELDTAVFVLAAVDDAPPAIDVQDHVVDLYVPGRDCFRGHHADIIAESGPPRVGGRSTDPTAALHAKQYWLVQQVPELEPILREHVAFNDELLSYVVFEGEFLRWFVNRARAGDLGALRRFVTAMEPLLTTTARPPGEDRVWNLAAICFVDGLVLQGDDDVVDVARPWMGPRTRQEIDRSLESRQGGLPPSERR